MASTTSSDTSTTPSSNYETSESTSSDSTRHKSREARMHNIVPQRVKQLYRNYQRRLYRERLQDKLSSVELLRSQLQLQRELLHPQKQVLSIVIQKPPIKQ
jgi:hypothetical protein